ncbi:hypothetical protein ACFV99_19915 [Streptomyces sp. NPDC059944]
MSTPVVFAADGSPSLLLIVAAFAVVLLLPACFGYGGRRTSCGSNPGARQSERNQAAARSSQKTPADETDTLL